MPGSRLQIDSSQALVAAVHSGRRRLTLRSPLEHVRNPQKMRRTNRFAAGCFDDPHRPKGALCMVATELKVCDAAERGKRLIQSACRLMPSKLGAWPCRPAKVLDGLAWHGRGGPDADVGC